jgi:hypothetical protein
MNSTCIEACGTFTTCRRDAKVIRGHSWQSAVRLLLCVKARMPSINARKTEPPRSVLLRGGSFSSAVHHSFRITFSTMI